MTNENKNPAQAILYSSVPPDETQKKRLCDFISEKNGNDTELVWKKSDEYPGGFRLEIGVEVYDWSIDARLEQFRDTVENTVGKSDNIIPLLKDTIRSWTPKALANEVGTVISVGDGIAQVKGLEHATYGEILLFTGGIRGMVQNLDRDSLGCILFDEDDEVCEGSHVLRTKKTAGIPVGDDFIGRVVNALGAPIDGLGDISADDYGRLRIRRRNR